ncbi:MAG TPA: polysaccharide deacetylase family protein [Gaiellaceae bacterium]|nr:polysaccharide deacetylase family protein [Gaiellaceae bacterium]
MGRIVLAIAAAWAAVTSGLLPPQRLPARLPSRTVNVPILMYHRVGKLPKVAGLYGAGLTVRPRAFAAQMDWLHAHGFHAISMRQLFDGLEWGAPLPPRPVAITFDDGYRDVLWNAEPVLHRLHMPATAFIITDRVSGSDSSFLTWRELRDLERDGFTIGSHTVHHVDLAQLSPSQAWLELSQSRRTLQRRLGVSVPWFAYPAGEYDPQVLGFVRRAGYLLAVTTHAGFAQSARQPFRLHRDEIIRGEGVAGLAALLQSAA